MKQFMAARLHMFRMAGRRAIDVNEASPVAIIVVEIDSIREAYNSGANRAG
jgi:hypothetical protein